MTRQIPPHTASAQSAAAITPNDSTVLDPPTRALYVGVGGELTVRMLDGEDVTFASVPAGSVLPICVDKVYDANTDADSIVALY